MVEFLTNGVGFVNGIMWGYILIAMLVGIGAYFSLKTGFVQLTMVKDMIGLLKSNEKAGKDGLSSFQAFCISTASRVGTGNIVGIALAIGSGGPGAVFWMWLFAIIGASSAFIESTLAQIFKVKDKGGYKGGPAYYMEQGLKSKTMARLFAIALIGFIGLIVHAILSNSITTSLHDAYNIDLRLGTAIVAALTLVGILGGAKKIGRITEILVPIMATLYIGLALVITAMNIELLPQVFSLIIESAFGIRPFIGGSVGSAIMIGIQRGLFSNEAGMGSAPNAAASASVTHPAKQGLIQTLGVFVDTLLICNATAFMIFLSGDLYLDSSLTGITLVQRAVTSHIGTFGTIFISLSIFLFSLSTIFGCYFYGETNVKYLNDSKISVSIYKAAVVGMVIFGGVAKSSLVWSFGDFFMGIMSMINLVAIVPLAKYALDALADYKEQRAKGLNPIYSAIGRKGLEDIDCWHDVELEAQRGIEEELTEVEEKFA